MSTASEADLLKRLWRGQLVALVRRLESGEELTAAEHQVVRQFLSDQGVNRMTLTTLDHAEHMALMLQNMDLPTFDDLPPGAR